MEIQIGMLTVGMLAEHCYLVQNTDTKEMLVIDPGDHGQAILDKIETMQGRPKMILLTHGHFDHIGAADEIRNQYPVPLCCMQQEADVLSDTDANLSAMFYHPVTLRPDRTFEDGEIFTAAGIRVKVIHTPGHTKGGCCYYLPDNAAVFCGDTLFHGSAGRSDFPTGNSYELMDSLRNKILTLPEETKAYPGHDALTDIGWERRYNPFVNNDYNNI